MLNTNQKFAVFIEAKKKVQSVIDGLKKLEKKTKKTKKSREVIRVMEDFVRCNITSPAITSKYERVVSLLEGYSNVNKTETDSGT